MNKQIIFVQTEKYRNVFAIVTLLNSECFFFHFIQLISILLTREINNK